MIAKTSKQNIIVELLNSMKGASFISLDTETAPQMNRTIVGVRPKTPNPHYGHIIKRQTGASVMVFQNKKINGYAAMVNRRLKEEGIDTEFEPSAPKWGERLPGLPVVQHNGELYLEVIFMRPGTIEYFLDGQPIDSSEVIGLVDSGEAEQGGLNRKVILRRFKFESIKAMRAEGMEIKF